MSGKRWDDMMGVCKGLLSVIQSAQNSQVRVRAPPRLPSDSRLKSYSKNHNEFEESSQKQKAEESQQKIQQEHISTSINKPIVEIKEQSEAKQTSTTTEESKEEEDEVDEEVANKEKNLNYEDTPFYLKQDRPVFSGKERKVPISPSARALQFGMLGVSIVGGTVSEAFKQMVGISKPIPEALGGRKLKRYAMTDSNSVRISNTLCKMRGAALKIGQILSNMEDLVIPQTIKQAFERARREADIMPKSQVIQMMERELGDNWKNNFSEFNLYPIAAASIGQVHEARLRNGKKVAIKIQYPGIAESIDSDFKNLKRLIKILGIFPRGLYLDELMNNTRTELHEECDYYVESEKQQTYKLLLHTPEYINDFYVPEIYRAVSTKHIITQEFISGFPVDELYTYPQEIRDRAGGLMLKLCIHELFLFKFMQTDPNPANFYYDPEADRINLIDMGAARHFKDDFVNKYFQIVYGAAINDKERIIEYSKQVGFLTGEENKQMLESHSKSAMFVGEPFKHKGPYFDFGDSNISKNLLKELPVMLKNRLSPPPQEVYSLHRKLSGAYFMCIKLKSRVNSREIFNDAAARFMRTNKIS